MGSFTSTRGAAWIAAVDPGEISFADVPQLTEIKQVYTPKQNNRALYDERFAIFVQIYKRMKHIYQQLNAASS